MFQYARWTGVYIEGNNSRTPPWTTRGVQPHECTKGDVAAVVVMHKRDRDENDTVQHLTG